jgi:hypothetical protein
MDNNNSSQKSLNERNLNLDYSTGISPRDVYQRKREKELINKYSTIIEFM